jgi:hypothetical protein
MTGHVKGMATMRLAVITNAWDGKTINVTEAQIQKRVPLSLFMNLKGKYPEGVRAFSTSSGVL